MNAVYYLGPRMGLAKRFGLEQLGGGELNNRQFNDFFPPDHPLSQFFEKPDKTWTPRVLKDGSDSVGALGALNRVYINIGLFSEEWLLHFRPLLGGAPISPIEIAVAKKNSVYWQATELQTPYMDSHRFGVAIDPNQHRKGVVEQDLAVEYGNRSDRDQSIDRRVEPCRLRVQDDEPDAVN